MKILISHEYNGGEIWMRNQCYEFLLNAGEGYALLFLSPISMHVVNSFIDVAVSSGAPLAFIASLNQVDLDGGYTGWTPRAFADFVNKRVVEAAGWEYPVILQLDHGGPWLKDKHIERNYTYEEALSDFLKSLEEFLKAGFCLIHLDATVDIEKPDMSADPGKAASRTVELLAYSEDLAAQLGIDRVFYEVGSDRWGYKPPHIYNYFLSSFVDSAKSRKLDLSKIVFSVAHVGTEVKPGNKADLGTLSIFVSLVKTYGFKLKIHSGDYLENPEVLLEAGVGGVNIGPMFAHVMYSSIVKILTEKMDSNEAIKYIEHLNSLITSADRLSKYTGKGKIEEYKLGLASRYIWSRPEVRGLISKISQTLQVDIDAFLAQQLKKAIMFYVEKLKIGGLVNKKLSNHFSVKKNN
jgi:hypothetical protein